ncbi:hypothetical protein [Lysobacter sp. N42]|uniref:hypothetical protein n=1 Tax=Lysobacter sp. N42 TaxID=2545719 RepID=UPI00105365F6|nr:hypothetical protein [Lysobacter sp. N42]TCZ78099.1 hypothetical protein EYQ95_25785 [Lysobacter sp. N42]
MGNIIEAVHRQLLSELDRAGRADTVFVVSGVLFNILVLFVNWAQADSIADGRGNLLIFLLFTAGSLLVSCTALLALINSRRICTAVHASLQQLYTDQNVQQYIPVGLAGLGNKRFVLSFLVVGGTGLLAVLIPVLSMASGHGT